LCFVKTNLLFICLRMIWRQRPFQKRGDTENP